MNDEIKLEIRKEHRPPRRRAKGGIVFARQGERRAVAHREGTQLDSVVATADSA